MSIFQPCAASCVYSMSIFQTCATSCVYSISISKPCAASHVYSAKQPPAGRNTLCHKSAICAKGVFRSQSPRAIKMVFLPDLKPDSQNILSAANVILDFSYKDLSRFPHILHSLFRPKIPITASDRNAAFQDPVINPLMLQIRRIPQFI